MKQIIVNLKKKQTPQKLKNSVQSMKPWRSLMKETPYLKDPMLKTSECYDDNISYSQGSNAKTHIT